MVEHEKEHLANCLIYIGKCLGVNLTLSEEGDTQKQPNPQQEGQALPQPKTVETMSLMMPTVIPTPLVDYMPDLDCVDAEDEDEDEEISGAPVKSGIDYGVATELLAGCVKRMDEESQPIAMCSAE